MIPWLRSFGRLSWRLQAAWTFLAATAVILLAISAKFREKEPTESLLRIVSDSRRETAEQHERILAELRRMSKVRVGSLELSPPNPDINFGGVVVVIDMTGAASPQDPKAAEASKLFELVNGENTLVQLVLAGKVRIVQLRLLTPNPAEAKGGTLPKYAVELQLHTLSRMEIDLHVPRGQVFENTTTLSGFQNLATADEANMRLRPNELKQFRLLAYCINRGRRQPIAQAGYITPLRIKFDFGNQEALWAEIGRRVPAANTR
jgi:hypothetical protein